MKLLIRVLLLGCSFFLFLALIVYFSLDHALRYQIQQSLILSPTCTRYGDWVDVKGDQRIEVWFWNVTNANELKLGWYRTSKRQAYLNQIGPFVYTYKRHKHHVNFEGTQNVSFLERFDFQFNRSLSVADDDFKVAVFNYAAISILRTAADLPQWIQVMISVIISIIERDQRTGSIVTVYRNVSDLIFGYEDPFLHALKQIPFFSYLNDRVALLENPLEQARLTVSTGSKDSAFPTETVLAWKGQTKLSCFNRNECNKIDGTDGNLFTVPLRKRLLVFLTDLERTIELEREAFEGSTLARYKLATTDTLNTQCSNIFANSTFLFDLPCNESVAVVMSNPHFLFGNTEYFETIIDTSSSFSPNPSDHLTRAWIDKWTGYPIKVKKLIQISFMSTSTESVFNHFAPNQLYPVIWMNQSFTATSDDIDLLWRRVHIPALVIKYSTISLIGIAAFVGLVGGILLVYMLYTKHVFMTADETESLPASPNNETTTTAAVYNYEDRDDEDVDDETETQPLISNVYN